MANLVEVKGNLFDSILLKRKGTMIVHCISADYALGAGFALQLENRYHIRDTLRQIGTYNYPDCLVVDRVINLVTKGAYWTKPTYETFETTLYMARDFCMANDINILVMPKIGCGLDKLDWTKCKQYIECILVSNDIACCVYKLR